MLVAKPVLKNEFWILQKDQKKIGNIQSSTSGYTVTIGSEKVIVKNIQAIRKNQVVFEKINFKKPRSITEIYGYSTGCPAYNPVWDLKRKIPLFTKRKKSRCWFAAGWYRVEIQNQWYVLHNPKLIVIKRHSFQGPFRDADSASLDNVQQSKENNV